MGDALQTLRALAAYWFPRSPGMSRDEKIEELIEPEYRKESIARIESTDERAAKDFVRQFVVAEAADDVRTSRVRNPRKEARAKRRRRDR